MACVNTKMTSLDYTAAQIIAHGIAQAVAQNAPADMIARLQGALHFAELAEATALRINAKE